jgi:capsular polysaccharide transport system permease protein
VMGLTGLGVGLINCLLMGMFQVWERIWAVLSRPMFLISGVFFLYDDMPRVAQNILWWNPLIHGTGLVRIGFYPTYNGSYISLPYAFGVPLTLITLGLLFLGQNYRTVLER